MARYGRAARVEMYCGPVTGMERERSYGIEGRGLKRRERSQQRVLYLARLQEP